MNNNFGFLRRVKAKLVALKRSKEKRKMIWQFIKFCLVGVSNTVVTLTVYYSAIFLGIQYAVAYTLGWLAGVFNSYYWNDKYTFQSKSSWRKKLFKMYATHMVIISLNTLLIILVVEIFEVSEMIAPYVVMFIIVPMNFLISRFWVFR